MQADPLGDLVTGNNNLSVWEVEDDKSNLDQVIIALAATREHATNLDYALFDKSLLLTIGIKLENNKGDTPYEKANNFHRDLVELTAKKIVKLTESILNSSHKERVLEKKILHLIRDAVNNQQIDKARLKPDLLKKI
jgi:hypothetical protein